MIFALIFLAMLIIGIILGCRGDKAYWSDSTVTVFIIGLVGFVIFSFASLMSYMSSLHTYANLVAYSEQLNYHAETVTETNEAIDFLQADNGLLGMVAMRNPIHTNELTQRIKERRKLSVEYEKMRRRYKMYLNSWFCRRFIAKPSTEVQEIINN